MAMCMRDCVCVCAWMLNEWLYSFVYSPSWRSCWLIAAAAAAVAVVVAISECSKHKALQYTSVSRTLVYIFFLRFFFVFISWFQFCFPFFLFPRSLASFYPECGISNVCWCLSSIGISVLYAMYGCVVWSGLSVDGIDGERVTWCFVNDFWEKYGLWACVSVTAAAATTTTAVAASVVGAAVTFASRAREYPRSLCFLLVTLCWRMFVFVWVNEYANVYAWVSECVCVCDCHVRMYFQLVHVTENFIYAKWLILCVSMLKPKCVENTLCARQTTRFPFWWLSRCYHC